MGKVHSLEEVSKGRYPYLTGFTPAFEYRNNQKTDIQIGIRYFIVLPGDCYRAVSVLVSDMEPICSKEQLTAALATSDVPVTFDGFEGRWYKHGGNWNLTCTATAIRPTA